MVNEATKLPTLGSAFRKNLQAAASTEVVLRAGGLPWLDISADTGAMALGQSGDPLPDHEYALDVQSLEYGYLVWQGRRVTEEHMIPVTKGPRPVPPGGSYGTYPADGPVEVWRFTASSLDEPGLAFTFSAKNKSNILRCKRLLGAIAARDAVAPQFINPIVRFYPVDKWEWSDGSLIHCIGIHVNDWLAADGLTRQSRAAVALAAEGDEEPWEAAAAE